jgi:hypothetical protein
VGSDFQVWGNPVGLGDLADLNGHLSGVLENGDPLSVYFERRQFVLNENETLEGKITLVPEPGQMVMLASGIGCLIALRGHAKRRTPQPAS